MSPRSLRRPWVCRRPLGRVSVACGPPDSGSAADPGREAADELDAPSAARRGARVKRCLSLALDWRENGGDVRPLGRGPLGPASGIGGR